MRFRSCLALAFVAPLGLSTAFCFAKGEEKPVDKDPPAKVKPSKDDQAAVEKKKEAAADKGTFEDQVLDRLARMEKEIMGLRKEIAGLHQKDDGDALLKKKQALAEQEALKPQKAKIAQPDEGAPKKPDPKFAKKEIPEDGKPLKGEKIAPQKKPVDDGDGVKKANPKESKLKGDADISPGDEKFEKKQKFEKQDAGKTPSKGEKVQE
jgi:hypothetical protein